MSSATVVPTSEVPSADPPPAAAPVPATACYSIVARSDPGTLPRVLEPFAKRGLVLSRCHAVQDGGALAIDLELAGVDRDLAEYIGRCLRQIHLVDCVLTSTRPA